MIRKIKRYKISVRPHGVLRHLKKKVEPASDWSEVEQKINEEIARVNPLIVPSAIYNSFSKGETPEFLKESWKGASKKSLSLSLLLVNIGVGLENEIQKRQSENDPFSVALLEAIGQESLDESLKFVLKLLNEEAKSESCEVTGPLPVEPSLLNTLLPFLESHKADIVVNENGQIVPLYTSASYCFWDPLPKGRSASSR